MGGVRDRFKISPHSTSAAKMPKSKMKNERVEKIFSSGKKKILENFEKKKKNVFTNFCQHLLSFDLYSLAMIECLFMLNSHMLTVPLLLPGADPYTPIYQIRQLPVPYKTPSCLSNQRHAFRMLSGPQWPGPFKLINQSIKVCLIFTFIHSLLWELNIEHQYMNANKQYLVPVPVSVSNFLLLAKKDPTAKQHPKPQLTLNTTPPNPTPHTHTNG